MAPGLIVTWAAETVLERGKLRESVMRTVPPGKGLGGWVSILWVKRSSEDLMGLVVVEMGPGGAREPANMYFSLAGMWEKISGERRKFLERTEVGVWAKGG